MIEMMPARYVKSADYAICEGRESRPRAGAVGRPVINRPTAGRAVIARDPGWPRGS